MKRRGFVTMASAAVAASLWPALVKDAFGEPNGCDTKLTALAQVAAALRLARQAGKPLLVFVIPADDGAKWERGQVFGELLNHGTERDLAPLASVEVVCATMADLGRLVPSAGVGDPLMVLVRPDAVPATALQLNVELPAYPSWQDGRDWKEMARLENVASDARIATLGGLLRKTLGGAPAEDARRATKLAAEVRSRLGARSPLGARWANARGCGVDLEGEAPVARGCGMGHTPEKAQRFLYFFTQRF